MTAQVIQDDSRSVGEGMLYCAAFLITGLGYTAMLQDNSDSLLCCSYSLFINHKFHTLTRMGVDVRALVMVLLHQKAS